MSKRNAIVLSVASVGLAAAILCAVRLPGQNEKGSKRATRLEFEVREMLHKAYRGNKVAVISNTGRVVLPLKYSRLEIIYTHVYDSEYPVPYFWASISDEDSAFIVDTNGVEHGEAKYDFCLEPVMHMPPFFAGSDAVFARTKINGKTHDVILYTDGQEVDCGLFYDNRLKLKESFVVFIGEDGKKRCWDIEKRCFRHPWQVNKKAKPFHSVYKHPVYPDPMSELVAKKDEETGKWGVVDKDGQPKTEFIYDGIGPVGWPNYWDGVFPAQIGGLWGVFKLDGTVVVPPEYDSIDTEPEYFRGQREYEL